ncbi:hypothetical protein ACGFX4_21650 [Kitasatospora sp. NPDC048365]|uniref:hypothetical protein n=1 Tax=Kitasatospora sp. NPDC048365 TaxID=3364050 RepID=UPI00371A6D97
MKEPDTSGEDRRRRIDLSVTQVVASALAAVAGAVLASELGVYGTILGAAVVSVGATTGSAVFQHVFRRTGEQLRSAVDRDPRPGAGSGPKPVTELSSEWNEPRVVRARRRWTWKTYSVVSALVFVLAMVPIVAVEAAAGKPMHDITTGQDGSGTSFNPGRRSSTPQEAPKDGPSADPAQQPSAPPSTAPSGGPSSSPSAGTSPTPSSSPAASPSGSASGGAGSPAPSGEPSAAAGTAGSAVPGSNDAAATPAGTPSPRG